ncbi:GTPase/DUF3482 domain-containing protein [Marinobacter zhejiangensis]|uniref:Small GTP-binding protein domain-containing protein n=1 Tax=Marinobacter zhejiangensis TaxID=488535 RepID=A0A1I4LUD3_9GAMM|nr:GTPase/DUF3482 domain-containing protein [Marinobacter zhejiangensis]SFL94549.1 small GTP-binding protein domain-containing protein [Marinobacter zhejiangensis]
MTTKTRPAPTFAVVGHPNKGKSSVVSTLSQNDSIAVALEPGTTRHSQAYPLTVDGEVQYTLIDTPGFQRPRQVLAWLEAHSLSASDRAETVAAFVHQHRSDPRFHDECELLTPLIEGAGIIYVVDGSVPYSAENESEMEILRWTGRPSLALINSIGADDYSERWHSALGQFFQVVRKFNAVKAPFNQHLSLLKAFGQLEPAWEQVLDAAVMHLSDQRAERKSQAARLIASALEDMMGWQERRTLTPGQLEAQSRQALADQLRERWYQHQRQREQSLRIEVETLYQHHRVQRQEAELSWHSEHDLFSENSRQIWGVSRAYLATAGFGAGAVGGAGIDAVTLGSSLGTGALIGGLIGAAGSYFYGDRLVLPVLRIGALQQGLQTVSFGPVQDSQFGYVVLGRAVDHWWHIAHRNHAGRLPLNLEPSDSHWLADLDSQARHLIQSALNRCRKQRSLSDDQRLQLASAIEAALDRYHQWRLASG